MPTVPSVAIWRSLYRWTVHEYCQGNDQSICSQLKAIIVQNIVVMFYHTCLSFKLIMTNPTTMKVIKLFMALTKFKLLFIKYFQYETKPVQTFIIYFRNFQGVPTRHGLNFYNISNKINELSVHFIGCWASVVSV